MLTHFQKDLLERLKHELGEYAMVNNFNYFIRIVVNQLKFIIEWLN